LLCAANLYFKHYFLSIIMIGVLISYLLTQFSFNAAETLYIPDFTYAKSLFLLESHKILSILLGIYCIKEKHKNLGSFILLGTILHIYIVLIGDYISSSIIFLIIGLGLLYYSRRKNAKRN
ncbi:MAG: hypothetical protein K2I71_01860, partial [Helicobacter sp.]|nr:hypothetical protein [Helicobacter sp.]